METKQQAPAMGEQQGQQQTHQTQTGAQFFSPVEAAREATERYMNTLHNGLASGGNTNQAQRIASLRIQAVEFYRGLTLWSQPTREQALAITNFQQSLQWCVWSILTEPAR